MTFKQESQQHKNVDPEEIEKFAKLAKHWWDKNGKFKPLHDINPLRLNYIESKSLLNEKKILDVGCGGGILSESMALRGAQVTGIDMSEAPLEVAKLHAKESGVSIEYKKTTAEDFATKHANSFDVVTCLEMLEHVPDPSSVVNACAKLVKPGGHVFFSTINKTAKAWLFAIAGAEYILNLLPKGTHDWNKFIPPHELAYFCRDSDLDVKHTTGMLYNPLTKNYSLKQENLGVNYLMHTIKNE